MLKMLENQIADTQKTRKSLWSCHVWQQSEGVHVLKEQMFTDCPVLGITMLPKDRHQESQVWNQSLCSASRRCCWPWSGQLQQLMARGKGAGLLLPLQSGSHGRPDFPGFIPCQRRAPISGWWESSLRFFSRAIFLGSSLVGTTLSIIRTPKTLAGQSYSAPSSSQPMARILLSWSGDRACLLSQSWLFQVLAYWLCDLGDIKTSVSSSIKLNVKILTCPMGFFWRITDPDDGKVSLFIRKGQTA